MELKWWILIGIVILATIVIGLYYFSFYNKKTIFKKKDQIDQELLTIDQQKKSWILFSNTHLEYKKSKWMMFDNIILTDYCAYFINDLTSTKKITSHEIKSDFWQAEIEKDKKHSFKNPVKLYRWQIEKLKSLTKLQAETKVILIVDEATNPFEFEGGFCLKITDLPTLSNQIEEFEAQNSFDHFLSMKEKKQFMLILSNKVFAMNKKNILDPIDQKVVIGERKYEKPKFRK